jgi:circadian clock protein KaiC
MTDVHDLERTSSGIPGLDMILSGGFPKAGIHIVQGAPGTGKTTLGNQICYHHALKGERALYVTLLAESHARMLVHLGTMTFFDASRLPEQVVYISGLDVLDKGGLYELVNVLRREIAAHKASVLIIDGLVAAEDRAETATEFKKFIQELQAQTTLYGCTTFLLTTAKGEVVPPEHTMVDSVIELTDVRYGSRTERGLFVSKLRGSNFLPGRHAFEITPTGLVVYPRIEAAYHHSSVSDGLYDGKISTGVTGLDAMMNGGLPEASVTGLMGPTGIGKTTFGLHFLCAPKADGPSLLFGFYETPERLQQKAESLGLNYKLRVECGELEVLWQPQGEGIQDALAHRLLDAISRRGVKRLFLDGLGGFQKASIDNERISRFFSVLTNELRVRGVTTVYSMETTELIGSDIRIPLPGVSAIIENVIAMRFLELHSSARRSLAILKTRYGAFDSVIREFAIRSGQGVAILGPLNDEGVSPGRIRQRRGDRGQPPR